MATFAYSKICKDVFYFPSLAFITIIPKSFWISSHSNHKITELEQFSTVKLINVYLSFNLKVIDDEKRLKELELKKKAKKKGGDTAGTSTLDVPVPSNNNNDNNNKKSKIKTYDIKHDELDEDRTLIERGKYVN